MSTTIPSTPNQTFNNKNFISYNIFKNKPKIILKKNTILDYIVNTPELSNFYYLLKLSNLENRYNDPKSNYTLFLTENKDLNYNLDKISKNYAIDIINFSTLPTELNKYLLKTCQNSTLTTLNNINTLSLITLNNTNILDERSIIIKYDIKKLGGTIHYINKLLLPYQI